MITIYWPWLVILGFIIFLFALITWDFILLKDEDLRSDHAIIWADAWDAGYDAATDEAIAILNEYPEKYEDNFNYYRKYVKWYEDMMALKEGREYDK